MNHYERLKVTQDAPVEVIRAAYRALAGKLHPDRHGAGHIGPETSGHEAMAALNAAYEVLNDPVARAQYDASLLAAMLATQKVHVGDVSGEGAGTAAGRVDVDWLQPHPVPDPSWRGASPQTLMAGGIAGVALVAALVWGAWELTATHQMEQALSDQYSQRGPETLKNQTERLATLMGISLDGRSLDDGRPESARVLSAQELARLSDEQLIRALPDLTDKAVVLPSNPLALSAAAEMHPLDGGIPLALRTDAQLEDAAALREPPH